MRHFAIESHDRSESVAFRNQAKLARGKVVIIARAVHLLFVAGFEIFFLQILNRETHDYSPNLLAVVKNS